MEIRTLETTGIKEITATFNEAFADYFIKLAFTEEGMIGKMKSENILLKYSVGAFEDDRLVGFILHGYDVIDNIKTIYNAGTGVIPSFRGKAIPTALYQFIIPVLAKEGIRSHILEVFKENVKAFKIYEKIGFKTVRQFVAFKGAFTLPHDSNIIVKPIDKQQWKTAQAFMDFTPSWQNSPASIERGFKDHELIGAFISDKLIGYAAYAPTIGRVRQLAVDPNHRRQGVGKALISYMTANSKDHQLTITSIDESNDATLEFMRALKLEFMFRLFEMSMVVDKA